MARDLSYLIKGQPPVYTKGSGYRTSLKALADSDDRHALDKASNALVAREKNIARRWTEDVAVAPRRVYDAVTLETGYLNKLEPTRPALQYNSAIGRYEPADYSQAPQPLRTVAHAVKMSGRRGGSGQQGGNI